MKLSSILFLIFACFITSLSAQTIADANTLKDAYKENDALAKYNAIYAADNTNYEAVYNISYMNSRIGYRTLDAAAKKNYYFKAKEFATKALQLNGTDAESNFVMAVAMGRMAEIASTKERVAASKDIKKYSDLALKYNPNHAGAWHVLGKWNYRVANLSFAEESAAKLLGGKLDAASNTRAIECLNNAIRLGKQTMMYHYDLANVYNKIGKTAEAKEQLTKASNIYNMNPDNALVRRDVDALKANIK